MKLIPLPAFQDNYLWVLHDGHRAQMADPGDAQPVFACLQRERLQLEAILVTHHHPGHIGGVDALRDATGARVYGRTSASPSRWSACCPGIPGPAAHMNTP